MFRYRTTNLLLAGIMPGPKEAGPDEVQRFLQVLVNELLRLWKYGTTIVTPKYPQGRLVRVALVAVVCDKPAAHKMGGFGSHRHTNFCTMCWISQSEKATTASFAKNGSNSNEIMLSLTHRFPLVTGFPERTNERHRELQNEYLKCQSKAEKDKFVKTHATRWSELHRLPYFDICRMIVVDPMHNLFLGLFKSTFIAQIPC
jgi:Transposase family tnp2.